MTTNLINIKALNKLPDDELVALFSKTQHHAYFGELYRRYAHLGFGVCLKYLKDENESQDVLADVFKILFRKIPASNIQSFRKYFYTVVRNECIGRLRQRRTESARLSDFQKFEKSTNDFMENEGLIRLLDSEPSLESVVEEAIQKLNDEQRTCIRLFFYQNRSYKDIVETTGFSEKQVKSYLQNGKRNLKILLTDFIKKRNS